MRTAWLSDNLVSRIRRLGRSLGGVLVAVVVVLAMLVSGGSLRRAFRPMPYADPEHLVVVHRIRATSAQLLALWQNEGKLVESAAAYRWESFGIFTEAGGPERVPGMRVTENFFPTLKVRPKLGRLFSPSEREVLLSYDFWQRHYAGDLRAVGEHLAINGEKWAIVGVLPEDFWFLSPRLQFWIPLNSPPAHVVARLRPGASAEQANDELRAILLRHKQYPRSDVAPLREEMLRDWVPIYRFSLWAFGFVAVFAGLHVVRGGKRRILAGIRYAVFLLLKSSVALSLVSGVWLLLADHDRQVTSGEISGWLLVLFHALCCGAVYWSLLDQRYRCRICLRRLCMPVPTGSWSTPLLDRPGTEYICPYGHGKLNVAEVRLFGMEPAHWTYYGALWEELVHQETAAGQDS